MKKFANEIMENMAKELNMFQKEKKSASFIKQLVKIANHYDKKGMKKIANHIDDLLYVFAKAPDLIDQFFKDMEREDREIPDIDYPQQWKDKKWCGDEEESFEEEDEEKDDEEDEKEEKDDGEDEKDDEEEKWYPSGKPHYEQKEEDEDEGYW